MTKQEKSDYIKDLTNQLAEATNFYLTDISGLDAGMTSDLRRACYKANVKLSVTKNSFLEKAMQASKRDFGDLTSVLKGNTSVMYSDVGNAPAKVIKTFRKKSERPLLKGAFIEEDVYIGDEQLNILVDIKSKEELIGEVVTLLQSPAKNLISALKSGGGKISGIIKTLSNKNN